MWLAIDSHISNRLWSIMTLPLHSYQKKLGEHNKLMNSSLYYLNI